MKTQHLEVFVAVARDKSLRAAARSLGLTPPAVMRTIQELEAEVGVTLMVRSVRGIELTEYGAALRIRASQILEDGRRALDEIRQMQGEMVGNVSFGMTSSIALTLLAPALQRFRDHAPDARLTLSEEKFPAAAQRLRDGTVDFVASHVLPTMLDDDLESLALMSTDFVVMVRAGHPLSQARSLAELHDAEWLQPVPHEGYRSSALAPAFAQWGLPMAKRVMHCDSFVIALALVADTDIVGLFTRPLAARVAQFGLQQIVLDVPLPTVTLSAVTRRQVQLTPAAQYFLSCLQFAAQQLSRRLEEASPLP